MKLGGRMGIGSAETLENFLADLFVHGDMGRICVCLYRLPDYIAKGPWIRISSATLGYQWLEQIQE